MRKFVLILCLLLSCLAYAQQDSIMSISADTALAQQDSLVATPEVIEGVLHVDTMQVGELTQKADDSYLLNIIGLQSAYIKSKEDSIHEYRLQHDTCLLYTSPSPRD